MASMPLKINRPSFSMGKKLRLQEIPLPHVILRGAVNEYGKMSLTFTMKPCLNAIERYEAMGLENPFYPHRYQP